MRPLLAHIYEPHRVSYPCYVQPKLNGVRALYQWGAFQSRDQLPFPPVLLDHLAHPLMETFGPEIILDGELYVHGWPLQRINSAVTPVRLAPTEDTLLVQYHVFDQVDFTKDFQLRSPWFDSGPIKPVATHYVHSAEMADAMYAQWVAEGYEGMMYRLGNCPYTVPKQLREPTHLVGGRLKFLSDQDNRTWHLLKRKNWLDGEFYCHRVIEGEGKLSGTLGALECSDPNPHFWDKRFSVGSGLTDSERQHYWANPPISRQVKVKYLCLSSDGIPLNPIILAIL